MISCICSVLIRFFLHRVECGGTFNGTSGNLTSPNYPGTYPNKAKCDYTIIVPFGYTMELKLNSLDIEFDSNCDYDFMEIFDGPTDRTHRLGKFFAKRAINAVVLPEQCMGATLFSP